MSDRFDFEQQILKCWGITEDLYALAERYEHDDELSNFILGIMNVYELRHDKLWRIFEEMVYTKQFVNDRGYDGESSNSEAVAREQTNPTNEA